VLDSLPPMKYNSVYAVSAGGMIGSFVVMGVPVKEMIDYIVDRPWNKWVKFNLSTFSKMKGLVSTELVEEAMLPMMKAYDIDPSITIGEVYERMKVELHLFSVDLTDMSLVDSFDFKDLPLVKAIAMSCAVFPVFPPVEYNGRMYADGMFQSNFPIKQCLERHDPASIISINFTCTHTPITPETPFSAIVVSLMLFSIMTMAKYTESMNAARACPYHVSVSVDTAISSSMWSDFLESPDFRKRLIDIGRQQDVRNWFRDETSGLAS